MIATGGGTIGKCK